MIKLVLFILTCTFASFSFADQTATDYQRDQHIIKAHKRDPQAASQALNPQKWFKDYTDNPAQTSYYPGVAAYNKDLRKTALENLKNDPAGSTALNAYLTQPRFKINPNAPEIKQAQLIEDHSHALITHQSDGVIDCNKTQPSCKPTWVTKTCITAHPLTFKCSNVLNVEVKQISHLTNKTASIVIRPSGSPHEEIDFMPLSRGKITGLELYTVFQNGPSGGTVHINHVLVGNFEMEREDEHHILMSFNNHALNVPISQGAIAIEMDTNDDFFPNWIRGMVYYQIDTPSYQEIPQWQDSCPTFPTSCKVTMRCTTPNQTRIIDGHSVTKPCWSYEKTLTCGGELSSACLSLQQAGCSTLSSHCLSSAGGVCQSYKDTYRCQTNQCTPPPVCMKPVFCSDGNCVTTMPSQNKNFGRDASRLATALEAGKEASTQNTLHPRLFGGSSASCHEAVGHFIDCCADSGWGKDLHLAHCNEEEKRLGLAKEHYLTTPLGDYCAHRTFFGVCTKRLKVYCLWPNKMTRIIQQQGRLGQLHLSFGSAKHPDCSGITPDEMQRLNLSNMNFENPKTPYPNGAPNAAAGIAADIKPNFPDQNDTDQKSRQAPSHAVNGLIR